MNRYKVWIQGNQWASSWYCFAESERDAAKKYIGQAKYKAKLAVQIVPQTKFFTTEELEG